MGGEMRICKLSYRRQISRGSSIELTHRENERVSLVIGGFHSDGGRISCNPGSISVSIVCRDFYGAVRTVFSVSRSMRRELHPGTQEQPRLAPADDPAIPNYSNCNVS